MPSLNHRIKILFPTQIEFLMISNTVIEIEIDQRLIRDPGGSSHRLEIIDGIHIDVDRDLFLQPFGIRVLHGVLEIIFISHIYHLIHYGHCTPVPRSLLLFLLK